MITARGRGFLVTAVVFCFFTVEGCYSYRTITPERDEVMDSSYCAFKVETMSGDLIEFSSDSLGCATISSREIRYISDDGSMQRIPMKDVRTIYARKPSTSATIGNIAYLTIIAGVLVYGFAGGLGGGFLLR